MANIYIKPGKDSYKYTCPHCNTISQVEMDTHKFQNDLDRRSYPPRYINVLTIHRCQCCGKKILWIDDTYIYPDIIAEEANADMPTDVKQLYDEAALIYNKSPRAACALLRLAVERLCHDLGETDRDINKNIGALVKRGLSPEIQQALDIVRVVGNKAVHPGQIEFDVDNSETAIMLMQLLNIITERMIAEPRKINALFQSLPDSARKSIEDRDK